MRNIVALYVICQITPKGATLGGSKTRKSGAGKAPTHASVRGIIAPEWMSRQPRRSCIATAAWGTLRQASSPRGAGGWRTPSQVRVRDRHHLGVAVAAAVSQNGTAKLGQHRRTVTGMPERGLWAAGEGRLIPEE